MWFPRTELNSHLTQFGSPNCKSHCHLIAPPDSGDERAATRQPRRVAPSTFMSTLRTANGIALMLG
jgi:hypothetical protein